MTTLFEGEAGIQLYRAIALKAGLALYMKAKIKPNRDWTPTAMLRAAGEITGKTYVLGQYRAAIDDLEEWINAQNPNPKT